MRLGALVGIALAGFASPAAGEFRFDEIEPRGHRYNDEYFINIYSYRRRLTYRWLWDRYWDNAAIGYDLTAGSLRNDELYLDQRSRVRLPFGDSLAGEYRFVESEDYDARFQRHEVEITFRAWRPAMRLPLGETLGATPRPDGLFVGGTGVLAAAKESADVGLVAGYRGEWLGVRFDAIAPDFFFNEKNQENAEYTSDPYTLRGEVSARLLEGALQLAAWVQDDLPLRLELPERNGGMVFRYRQVRAGLNAAWWAGDGVRVDLQVRGERTRKRRRSADPDPYLTDRADRVAFGAWVDLELDVAPLVGSSSRPADTVLFGLHFHRLDEEREILSDRSLDETIRRGEGYGHLGYVLGLPSPAAEYRFAIRAVAYTGLLAMREDVPREGRSGRDRTLLAKLALGFEAAFREDRAYAFVQFTWRADDQSFGGGNAQVMISF